MAGEREVVVNRMETEEEKAVNDFEKVQQKAMLGHFLQSIRMEGVEGGRPQEGGPARTHGHGSVGSAPSVPAASHPIHGGQTYQLASPGTATAAATAGLRSGVGENATGGADGGLAPSHALPSRMESDWHLKVRLRVCAYGWRDACMERGREGRGRGVGMLCTLAYGLYGRYMPAFLLGADGTIPSLGAYGL